MATVLSTSAVTLLNNQLLVSTGTSPSVRLGGLARLPAVELTFTVPDAGVCALITEASTNNGTSWFTVSSDGLTGSPVSTARAGTSSSIRIFTRLANVTNDSNTLIRARLTDLVGTWRLTAKVDF